MYRKKAIEKHYEIKCNINESKKILEIINTLSGDYEREIEYKNRFIDKIIEAQKRGIVNLVKSCCDNCIYSLKINDYTYTCNNDFSPIYESITDKNFWCVLGRIKEKNETNK